MTLKYCISAWLCLHFFFYIVKVCLVSYFCFSVIMGLGLVSMFLPLGLATAALAYILIFVDFGIGLELTEGK